MSTRVTYKQRYTGWAAFLLLLWPLCARAQDEIVPVRHFDRYNGLPAKVVYNLSVDPDGFVWLASENGVVRFDGKTFYLYTTADGLLENDIVEIHADAKGNIWCGGYNGSLSVIRNGLVDTAHLASKNWNHRDIVLDMGSDASDNLYVLDENQHLYVLGPTCVPVLLSDSVNLFGVGKGLFWTITGAKKAGIFRTYRTYTEYTESFLPRTRMHIDTLRFSRADMGFWINWGNGNIDNLNNGHWIRLGPLYNGVILTLVEQVDERHVVLQHVNRSPLLYDLFTHTYRRIRLPENTFVVDAVKDNQKNIWLSAYGNGLFAIKPTVDWLMPDFWGNIVDAHKRNDTIWAVNNTGTLFISSDGHTQTLSLIPSEESRPRILNYASFVEHSGNLYLGISSGVFRIHGNRAQVFGKAGKDLVVYKDSVWFYKGAPAVYGRKIPHGTEPLLPIFSILPERPYAICLVGDTLWISTQRGVLGYDAFSGKFTDVWYTLPKGGRVEEIRPWRNGAFLFCSSNQGLLLCKNKKVLAQINSGNGLFADDCKEVDTCSLGWVVRHSFGLSLVHLDTRRVYTVSQWKGVPGSAINQIDIHGDTLLLSTVQGLVQTDIRSLFSRARDGRAVRFMRIEADGVRLFPENIQIKYGNEVLNIDFALPEYDLPYLTEYQWRINGNDWKRTSTPSLEFVNLQPGDYLLEIKARAPGNDWTQTSELHFSVTTPFWRTWWFMGCVLLLLLGLVWFIIRRRYRNKLAEEREKTSVRYQLMDFEQKALNAMMNPHFVFNAMGSIQHLLNTGNNQQANDYLVKFSRLIRKSLETSQLEFCYLDDEIERLTLYLQLEKMRFGGRMDFGIDVADDVDAEQVKIPTMILQTYVENAIIHGVAAVRHQARVSLRFWMENNILHAAIEDNGPGFDVLDKTKRSVRFGVSATEKRLELLTQLNGKPFSVKMLSPVSAEGGTRVELLFSIKE